MWTAEKYEEYQKAVEQGLRGLTHLSTGACRGCATCALPEDATDEEVDARNEESFSWQACDACGTSLGGTRYSAHGRSKDLGVLHLEVCPECLYYINYGHLDDMSMSEVEDNPKPRHAYRVHLACVPDDDPETGRGGTREERWTDVESFQHASRVVREFIEEWNLGASQWAGGWIVDHKNQRVARISYNGRIWDPEGKALT